MFNLKKNLFIASLFLTIGLPLHAQTDVVETLASQTCSCLEKKDATKLTKDQLQMQLGICMVEALGKNEAAAKKKWGAINMTDQSQMYKIGEEVGSAMVFKCPNLMMQMVDTQTLEGEAEGGSEMGELTGTIKAIEGAELAVIVVQDEAGKAQKLVWYRNFEGSDRFITEPQKTIGKKVEVVFEEVEVYSPQAKDYYTRKEVVSITFLN